MKTIINLFRKKDKNCPNVANENYFIKCPKQAVKSLNYFGKRFNLKLYIDYLNAQTQ